MMSSPLGKLALVTRAKKLPRCLPDPSISISFSSNDPLNAWNKEPLEEREALMPGEVTHPDLYEEPPEISVIPQSNNNTRFAWLDLLRLDTPQP